ncbi:glycosyl hydrolase family 65 protein [Actinosynnema sp. NPDC059335]|uniref:glycosyl hydrolase family 65 protein n=1 Tax=Actinosynnema sp. NPDC059335 TaxID=3346804 RepID=UPI0036714DD6
MTGHLGVFDGIFLAEGDRLPSRVRRRVEALRALGVPVHGPPDADRAAPTAARRDSRPALVVDPSRDQAELCRLLDEEIVRRTCARPPDAGDAAWTLREGGDPLRRRVVESLFTVGAGGIATRGAVEEARPDAEPSVLAAGAYTGRGSDEHLLEGPIWTGLDLRPAPEADHRVLDLRTGTLARQEDTDHPVWTLRFASITRPGVVAMRAEGPAGRLRTGKALRPPPEADMAEGVLDGDRSWASTGDRSGVTAVAWQRLWGDGDLRTAERIAAYAAGGLRRRPSVGLVAALDAARQIGFDGLLAEHRAAWADRWAAVDVEVPDDPELETAVRFALFQLWSNVDGRREVAVGARGLSGAGYSGHVFWDADVYVLPAVLTMHPRLAAAMVDYRVRRLPAARVAARAAGRAGARFPWESASDGSDVTPARGHVGGVPVEIRTGRSEEHITADVAWAAWHCARWTGRSGDVRASRALLEETARYWASRCRVDEDGRAHIDDVMGPDEYHERVSDNAFTNVMARWNLRAAADSTTSPGQRRAWTSLATSLVDGYRPDTGLYEQFAGYFGLEPLTIDHVARPPVAADVLLGRERVAATQIIKQPDVLMLHHLVPEEVRPGSLGPNVDFYAPRTAHGSSLSPAISASLLARAGRPEEALSLLRTAARIDLDDLTGTTAAGLHLAAMGGVWQALLGGFAGVGVRDGTMRVDPSVPASWRTLGLRFHCLGRRVRLRITRDDVWVEVNAPLRVALAGHGEFLVTDAVRVERMA